MPGIISRHMVRRATWLGLGFARWMIVGSVCLLPACQPGGPADATIASTTQTGESMASEQAFDIFYTAYSGRPPVDARLHIFPDGRAELYLGSSWSVPGGSSDQVGFFGTTLSPETLRALNAHLLREKFLSRPGVPAATPGLPGGTVRGVTLTLGGQQVQLTMRDDGKDKPLAKLEQMLMDILKEVAQKPVRAARATLALAADGPNLRPEVTITNVGTEPLAILFFDPSEAGWWLRAELTFLQPGRAYDTVAVSREEVVAWVDAGRLPSGVQSLEAGASYRLTLPSVLPPSNDPSLRLAGKFIFWLPGIGPERRRVDLQTAPIPAKPTKPEGNPGSAKAPSALELGLTSERQRYKLDEAIYVAVSLRNVGTAPLTVNGRLLLNHDSAPESVRDLYFEISGPAGYGNQRLFRVNAGAPTERDLVRLEAGGVHQRSIELTRFHSLHLPGQYTLIAHYLSATPVAGFEVWLGQLQSQPLVLERR